MVTKQSSGNSGLSVADAMSMWGRCGIDVGSMSGRCGVRVRPMSGRCAVDVRPIWGRCHVGVCEERKACAVIVVTEEQQQNCGHSSLYQSFTSTKEIKSSQEDEVHTDP